MTAYKVLKGKLKMPIKTNPSTNTKPEVSQSVELFAPKVFGNNVLYQNTIQPKEELVRIYLGVFANSSM